MQHAFCLRLFYSTLLELEAWPARTRDYQINRLDMAVVPLRRRVRPGSRPTEAPSDV